MKYGARARKIVGVKLVRVLVLLVWISGLAVISPAGETAKPRRVLALYWYGKDFPSNVEFDQGLQAVFRDAGIEYYAEYFEPNRFPGEGAAITLRDYLQRKYSERTIDVVVAMSVVAADFLLKYRDVLFPGAPIVFHTSNVTQLNQRTAGIGSPGVVPDNVYARTLETALSQNPGTEHVFVINGTIERSKAVEVLLREQLKELEGKVEITYLTDLTLDGLLVRVKSLPARSLIFYGRQDYEDPGRSLSVFDVLVLVANSAKVPIYSSGGFVGYGTIGGYTVNTYECGVQAAAMAVQIINGVSPEDIGVVEIPSSPIFDWRQLRRWSIREDQLPAGSQVRFREPTLFEQYRWRIIGGLALVALQSFLIAGLLAEVRKRHRAQEALHERLEFQTLLSELSADFNMLPANEIENGIERWLQRIVKFLGASSGTLFKLDDRGPTAPLTLLQTAQMPVLKIATHFEDSEWMLTFSSTDARWIWREDLLPKLRLAGEIMAGALVRKASEDALRESQERYTLATKSGSVIVWDWDLATSKVYADPLLEILLGFEEDEILNFDDWMRLVHPEDVELVMERVHAHIDGELPRFAAEHRFLQKDGGIRWFLAGGSVVRNAEGIAVRMVGTETDITERKLAEQELRRLSTRLLDLRDQERQRIARELHDGTAQNIWAIGLNLEYLTKMSEGLPEKVQHTLSECRTLCEHSLQEIRTLSYMLHPPMMDQVGLCAALRWYLDGFAKRSGLDIKLTGSEDLGSLPREVQMDLFRIVQECIANVHRHSGSQTAQVSLERQPTQLLLRVQDQGHGMPVNAMRVERDDDSGSFGVGVPGMSQRLRHVGGHLEITSSNHGTTVTAIIPLASEYSLTSTSVDRRPLDAALRFTDPVYRSRRPA